MSKLDEDLQEIIELAQCLEIMRAFPNSKLSDLAGAIIDMAHERKFGKPAS